MTGPTLARLPRSLAVLVLGALVLAACDSSDDDDRTGIRSLGNDFVRAFNQDRNDEPFDADDVDLRLTPTIEPFDV